MKLKYTLPLLLCLLIVIYFKFYNNNDSNNRPSFDVEIGSSTIPYIQINTAETIQNEPKTRATMEVFIEQSHVFSSTIGIEYRGSSSFRASDKKSYGIKFWDENKNSYSAEILGLPKEEDWILMGHVFRASNETIFDPSLMHHYIGYELYRSMDNYASRGRFVELEIDYEYQGLYIFMEKLKRDKNRININNLSSNENEGEDLTGGYIIKVDKISGGDVAPNQPLSYYESNWDDDTRYSEEISFRSRYDINGSVIDFDPFLPASDSNRHLETYFVYEYPKAENITDEQKKYIQEYVNNFETALLKDDFTTDKRTYTDFIDLDSFVDFFIINELAGNVDAYRLSTYMHKNKSGLLKMGPTWDLNIGYGRQDQVPKDDWIVNYNQYKPKEPWLVPFWWSRLLEDPLFKKALKNRWTALRSNKLSDINVIGLVDKTSTHLISNGVVERNYKKWTGIEVDYNKAISELKTYLEERLNWMDTTIETY